ncbi:MAG TPA: 6,7-dimethyl-8-ribityllumazine synthase [Candidatus Thermoplasmatota archaeon]|nr:6,7-dimethyl-8-ribityllumazine synthase [Candidatus Thermoplasmatota archaeon]
MAIAVAHFNRELTHAMRDRAVARAKELGYDPSPVVSVEGTYDLPFAVAECLRAKGVVAAVAIGVVVTGETKHDELIAHAAAKSLLDLSLAARKPVGLAVTGPGQTYAQAEARLDRAEAAVEAAHAMLKAAKDAR